MQNQHVENKQHGSERQWVCKTFIRRFDSDPRLHSPTNPSSNQSNSLGQNQGHFPTAPRLRAFALSCGTSAGAPGPKPDSLSGRRCA